MADLTIHTTVSDGGTISSTLKSGDTINTTVTQGSQIQSTITGGAKGDKGDKGDTGATGATGPKGDTGAAGQGIPVGGTSGQVLAKNSTTDYDTHWVTNSGTGTVTAVSVTTANGVSGSVATATTTPAISLTLGDVTPTSVAATSTVTGSNLSGTNTGDETTATIKTKLGITTLSGSNTGDQTITLSGDVSGSGTGAVTTAIGNNKVTNAQAAQMAANTLKGNNTGSTANATDLTATQATALLNNVVGDSGSGGTKGLVPAPASGDAAAGKFLKADGTWTAPSGSSSPLTTKGDLYTRSSVDARLPAGADGTVLSADSTQTTGLKWVAAGGTGTVTSVAVSGSNGIGVSGSPVTTTGTIALSLGAITPTSVVSTGLIEGNHIEATGANGDIQLTADTDGGEFNLFTDATGTLAIYGSTTNTLHLNLLDGDFKTASTVRITNAGAAKNLNLTDATNTFPTLNQNTTGTAAAITGKTTPTGALVGDTDTQTLTNKTLTTPVITGLPTGTGLASGATASTIMTRDGSSNAAASNLFIGFATTATAAGTTTLTIASKQIQVFTGSSTQTVKLPTTSIVAGVQYQIINQSSGAVTVQSSGANNIIILPANTSALLTALVATPTTAANWYAEYLGLNAATGKALTVSNSLTLAGTDGTTMTFPTGSDTLMGRASTDTMTNKTFDTLGAGNVLKINGTQVSAVTGTASVVLSTAPLLTQPNILGAASVPTTPLSGQAVFFGVGTGTVRPHWINSSGTDETIVTNLAPSWTAPTLLNSWTNLASFNTAGYYIDQLGIVHLRGVITGGTATSSTTLFTLPSGFRPTVTHVLAAPSNDAFGEVRVDTSGNVKIWVGATNWISLDSLTFPTF